jgi:hypothetical protein
MAIQIDNFKSRFISLGKIFNSSNLGANPGTRIITATNKLDTL